MEGTSVTIDFTKKHYLILVIVIVIAIAVSVGSYFLLLKPEKTLLAQKESQLDHVEQELEIVENKLANLSEKIVINSAEIQKQVPVKPLVEQLLLDIDRAELVSKSRVSQVSIGSTGEEVSFPAESASDDDDSEESSTDEDDHEWDLDAEDSTNNDEDEETSTEGEVDEYLPRGMKMVKVSIQAEADDYFAMEKFIDVIQTVQRIIRIDSINFSGQTEITSIDDEISAIPFSVNLTAFYFPKLTQLIDELPKLDLPAPSQKRNPFVNFSDSDLNILKQRQEEANAQDEGQTGGQQSGDDERNGQEDNEDPNINNNDNKAEPKQPDKTEPNDSNRPKPTPQPPPASTEITHVVRPGDTIFSLSMKYYGSQAGKEKIRAANGMSPGTNLIIIGQTLKIPR